MDNVLVQIADETNANEIFHFKSVFYDEINPIEAAYPKRGIAGRSVAAVLEAISFKTVLIATEKETNKLVGILIAAPIDLRYGEILKRLANEPDDEKAFDVYSLLVHVEEKANLFERFCVKECLQIQVVCVHPDHRRQSIATKLFHAIFDVAISLGYKLISVDCSSVYAEKIAENLEMNCIASVTYKEYNEQLGRDLFKPIEPHLGIKVYAKRL